jgi:hypothetical protein
MRTCMYRFVTLVLAFVTSSTTWAASTDDRQPAVWKSQELLFAYAGFTSRYSCEGLRDKVADTLAMLGARGDMSVTPYPCSGLGRPEPFPGVRIKISTLAPATEGAKDTVEARWKTVHLSGPGKLTRGDCELAEQIQHEILPLFTTRNVKAQMDCIPHQESAGDLALTVDVLVPAKDDSSGRR